MPQTIVITVINADVLLALQSLPAKSVQVVITSPPYLWLRNYGVKGQIGLEKTPAEFIAILVAVFREIWRVLRDDGTVWLNMGDSYAGSGKGPSESLNKGNPSAHEAAIEMGHSAIVPKGWKAGDLMGMPWRLVFALQDAGWWLRTDIIWCLSGGTYLYVRSQKGDMPMQVKDIARLDPATVKLWNGKKWTQLLGMNRNGRRGDELELVMRSGERISCTPMHQFPTSRGLIRALDLNIGDVIDSCRLPEPERVKDCAIDEDAAWLAGLYLAEGSMAGDTIQIAGHVKEQGRWERIQRVAKKYGGTATKTDDGNTRSVRVYGKILVSLIRELVSGHDAHDKGISNVVWRYSNKFVGAYVRGYLDGDGHWDEKSGRWRIGFCRNYNLERDLRTACARLGYRITLNMTTATMGDRTFPAFHGELRTYIKNGHFNERDRAEIIEIRKSRCRYVYDLGVEDDPHVFSLASGILTHNSKPNPMPESNKTRPTRSHEFIFLLTKSGKPLFWTHPEKDGVRKKPAPDYYYHNRETLEDLTEAPEDWATKKHFIDTDGKSKRIWIRRNKWIGWNYFYDAEAIKEPVGDNTHARGTYKGDMPKTAAPGQGIKQNSSFTKATWRQPKLSKQQKLGKKPRDEERLSSGKSGHFHEKEKKQDALGIPTYTGFNDRYDPLETRNRRDVWRITTKARPEAHFASFPDELPKICIAAGTSEYGCCPACGAPYMRVLKKVASTMNIRVRDNAKGVIDQKSGLGSRYKASEEEIAEYSYEKNAKCEGEEAGWTETVGWRPTCSCQAGDPVPCVTLDPFMGRGTVALVSREMGRSSIGIDLNPEYCEIARMNLMGEGKQKKKKVPQKALDTGVVQYDFKVIS